MSIEDLTEQSDDPGVDIDAEPSDEPELPFTDDDQEQDGLQDDDSDIEALEEDPDEELSEGILG